MPFKQYSDEEFLKATGKKREPLKLISLNDYRSYSLGGFSSSMGDVVNNPDFAENSQYIERKPSLALDDYSLAVNKGLPTATLPKAFRGESLIQGIGMMTPEEKSIYNYYYNTQGNSKANEYLRGIEKSLIQRAAHDIQQEADTPIKKAVYSALGGLDSGMRGLRQIGNIVTGKEAEQPSALEQGVSLFRQDDQGIQKIANDLLYSAGNMVPSLLVGNLTGPVGGAITQGLSSGGNNYADAIENGKSVDDALLYGTLSGLSEGGLQYLLGGIGNLGKGGLIKTLGKTGIGQSASAKLANVVTNPAAKKVLTIGKDIVSNVLDEATEEYIQAIIDPVLRNTVLGENNEINPLSEDTLYSALLGGITGGAFSLPSAVSSARVRNTQTENREVPAINREPDTSLVRSSSISPEPLYDTSVTQNTPDVNTSISENGGMDAGKQTDTVPDMSETAKAPSYAQAEELHRQAQAAQERLVGGLHEAVDTLGFSVEDGGAKSVRSILDKVARKQAAGDGGYDLYTMKDHARAAVLTDRLDELPAAVVALKKRFPAMTGEAFLEQPLNNTGYRGVHLTVPMGDGINAEIQIHTKETWRIKKLTDAIYDKWRNVEIEDLTEQQRQQQNMEYARSAKLWDAYYSGVAPEVIRMASDSVMGLASQKSAARPRNGTNEEFLNSIMYDSEAQNNRPSSDKEYFSIPSTPSLQGYYSGVAPEVIRMASDSVMGLASQRMPQIPLYGFQTPSANSTAWEMSKSFQQNNRPSSDREYFSIPSTPSLQGYYSGVAPEVIRRASDSVMGLASSQRPSAPTNGTQEPSANSYFGISSMAANTEPLSDKEYLSIPSTPSSIDPLSSDPIIPQNVAEGNGQSNAGTQYDRYTQPKERWTADNVPQNASRFVVPDMSETAKAARANAVRESGAAVGIDQAVIDTAAEVAANTGRNIQFVTTIGEGINGRYDSGTNTLTIAADSQNPLETVLKHELTHSLEETGAYTELRDYVVREMIEPSLSSKGVHIADVVEAKMAQYAEAGAPISYDEAMREVVADYSAAKLFTDETAIRKLTAEKPGLARRFLDWIHSVYEKIRTRFRGTSEEQRLSRAEQLYQEALQSPMARRDGTQFSLVGRNEHGIEVYETSPEIKKLSYRERMKVFLDIMENQYKGRTAKFLRNGHPYYAGFESSDVRKNIYGDKRSDSKGQKAKINVGADGDIFELVENAHYNGSRPESGKSSQAHKGVSHWDYFIKTVQIDGVIYDIVANIRKKADGSYVYSIQLNENKKIEAAPPLSNDVAGNNVALNRAFTTSIDTSVTQNTPDVNTSISANGGADTGKQSIGTTSGDIDQDMLELVNRYSRRQETPIDIAQMRPEEANTTPPVAGSKADTGNGYTAPRVQASRGDSQSHFAENLQGSPVVDERFKEIALEDIGINTYDSITDQDTLTQANNALNDGGYKYVTEWFSKPTADATAQDIATGIILMSRYQATGDYEGMVNAARKLRGMGTNAGQTVQMFSILGRMTPEGMIHYAQKGLDDAFELMVKNRSKAWADRNREKFRLSDADVQFILDKTQKAAKLPAGRDKNILLGEIAARIQNKLPPEKGQNIRALARISMLLNPKTFVRNVLGNVSITPVSWIDDLIGAGIDRAVSKASGTRTTGGFRPSSVKGLWEGMSESFADWRRKINTRDIDADRFEIGQGGPNFRTDHKVKPLNGVSKALNALDRFTSFTLDVGDRPFFNMWFMNSLNNQMKLNGVSKPTAEMIEVARQDALSRTWQDTNGYTKFVSNVKNALNAVNVGGYGLGDVFIKFTKTPANLTKALVDYSPVGVVRAIASDGRKFSQALAKGEAAPQMQRKFVNSLAKGITGSILMVLMASLANAGVLKGKGSDDPDVADFEENVLGLQPYSVKIGDKTYSYEWMQPLGGTAAIIADIVQTMKEGDADEFFSDNPNANAILSALQSGGQVLYDQSFMQSLANLFESDNMVQGILNGLLSEPSAFVPQLFSQIAMLTDDTARRSYVSGQPLDTAVNKVKAKIPGLRSELEPVVDVLGRDVPSNNSLTDVFLNPANTSTARPTEAANEMYRLYNATGDIRVIPPKAPNTITYTSDGDTVKKALTAKEKTEYQRITGEIAQSEMDKLIGNSYYRSLTDEERADLMADIYSYANAIAKSELSDYTLSAQNEKQKIVASTGLSIGDYLMFNMRKDADGNDSVTQDEMRGALDESGFTEGQKAVLWKLQNKAWKFNPYRSQDDYVEEILKGALS